MSGVEPGQASAGAARCTRGAIASIGPVQRGGLDLLVERRRARGPPGVVVDPFSGITSVSGADVHPPLGAW